VRSGGKSRRRCAQQRSDSALRFSRQKDIEVLHRAGRFLHGDVMLQAARFLLQKKNRSARSSSTAAHFARYQNRSRGRFAAEISRRVDGSWNVLVQRIGTAAGLNTIFHIQHATARSPCIST